MEFEKPVDETVIIAYLRGDELDQRQLESVEQWLKHEENRREARNLYQTWELTALYSDRKTDLTKGLKAVRSRIAKKKRHVLALPHWQIGIAACVTLCIAAFWFSTQKKSDEQVVIAGDSKRTSIALPDHSVVTLRANTVLTYNESEFASSLRKIYLQGDAFFAVSHDVEKPFVVQTHDATIQVTGTAFMVKCSPDRPTQVIVTEGSVEVSVLQTGKKYILNAGTEITVSGKPSLARTSNVNTLYLKTGIFKFENDSLSAVFRTLSEEFDATFDVKSDSILVCKLTATFRKQSLEMITRVIAQTHGLDIRNENDTIFVEGNGCK